MNLEVHHVEPEPGIVVEIYHRQCGFDFLVGFCRGLILTCNHVAFVRAFRRHSNPEMTVNWSELHEFGVHKVRHFVYGFVPEVEWMRTGRPEGGLL